MIYLVISLILLACFIWYKFNNQHTASGDHSKLKSPLVIFDFDGTICPSFDLFIDELNTLSGSYGHRKVEQSDRPYLRDLPAGEVLKALQITKWKLPFLMKALKSNVQNRILNLEPVKGMADVIHDLKANGFGLAILTSNSEKNVQAWLKQYNLDLFDCIFTGNNLFGKDKHLKTIRRNLTDVYYVGDEMRDMEAAKRAHVKSVAVTWGYNSREGLALTKPDYICNKADELRRILRDKHD